MVIMRSNYLPVYICKILLTCLFKANGNKKLNSLSTLLKLVYGIIYIYRTPCEGSFNLFVTATTPLPPLLSINEEK